MLILAIESSTSTGSVALYDGRSILGLISVNIQLTHSEGLLPAIDTLLTRTRISTGDLTAVAASVGPGSFTGLRVGLASAQGIAMAHGLPTVAVSTLEVLAAQALHTPLPVCPILTARKGWVYCQTFTFTEDRMNPETDPRYITEDDCLASIHTPTLIFGPGVPAFREKLQPVLGDCYVPGPPIWNQPRADLLAWLAEKKIQQGDTLHPSRLTPEYMAASQAEVKRSSA